MICVTFKYNLNKERKTYVMSFFNTLEKKKRFITLSLEYLYMSFINRACTFQYKQTNF